MAAGGYLDATGEIHVLAERWNGHAWRVVPAVTPSSQPNNFFAGVACPASSACIGVGGSFTNDPNAPSTGSFAERWNGHAWTLQPTPTQSTPGGFLGGVWCKSATACIATGSTNAGTLAERLSGTTWSVLPTPNPPATQGAGLGSISCTSLSACTSTGLAFGSPGGFPPQTLAERWNGVRWRIQPTPLLPGVSDISNFSVACPAQSSCIAAGGFENDGPGAKTLTERWRASGTSAPPTAPAAFSPRAYLGGAGCIRAAIGEGFAVRVAVTRPGPTIKALMPLRPRPASEIDQITALCGAA
jgi:putative hemolysin